MEVQVRFPVPKVLEETVAQTQVRVVVVVLIPPVQMAQVAQAAQV